MSGSSEQVHGHCWFCGRRRGDINSLALPFWSNQDDTVRVLVIPRCTPCFQWHQKNRSSSGLVVVGIAAATMVVVKLLFVTVLPVGAGWQTPGMIAALILGAGAGVLVVSRSESRAAEAAATRPGSAYLQHPEYIALTQDSQSWRAQYSTAATGGALRHETVGDRRVEFAANSRLAPAAVALAQAVRESGIDA